MITTSPVTQHNAYSAAQVCFTKRQADLTSLYSAQDRLRFATKVSVDASGCWLWTASRMGQDGYGQFTVMSQGGASRRQLHLYAHRVAWELANGPVPDGLQVCHHCDVPACVNPAHLFLGTQFDNMADAKSKGRVLGRPRTR